MLKLISRKIIQVCIGIWLKKEVSIILLVLIPTCILHVSPGILPILSFEQTITDWVHYHDYTELTAILLTLNATCPDAVDVFSIGNSVRNRDIYCVRLTNESNQKVKPEVFFVGYHHAREQISSELPLYFVVYMATHFGLNDSVTELLNESEIYVVVALNVDGFELFEANGRQRKNANNVDLNRNYGHAWEGGMTDLKSETYRGSAPFSEPETQAIRDLVLQHNFTYAISFHSGIELILYPWGYTHDAPPDKARFTEVATGLSKITMRTPYKQSSRLYISAGTWDDWMYGVAGVFALTCEIFGWVGETEPFRPRWKDRPRPRQDDTYIPPFNPPYLYTEAAYGCMKTLAQSDHDLCVGSQVDLKYQFNPYPNRIKAIILRWLPVFFHITTRMINEASSR